MATIEDHERVIAQLISGSLDGRSWRDLTPRLIAEHLVKNGVRYRTGPQALRRRGHVVSEPTNAADGVSGGERIIVLTDRTRFGGETGAGLMMNRCAFTSRDMAEEFGDAFTYAIVFGWGPDPEDPEDTGGALREQIERWGWDEPLLEFLRDAHERFAALPTHSREVSS